MLLVTLAIVLVSLVVQLVDGSQRIVYVSEPISDDKDLSTNGDGDSNLMCCVYGNCSCNSLDHALANLASNVLINITTDVMFTTLINASNLENVSIIGHNNPTVYCKRAGGIHFNFCHNCIIQDITWNGCGRETEPGIKLRDSSNIVIEKCSFQYSKGGAIVLSGVSGRANIIYCNFTKNINYRGHGAAIQYSSNNVTNYPQLVLAISNCYFANNKNAKSLVYIENMMSISTNNIIVQNTKFCHNKGTSIFIVNENVYLFEKVLFQNNTAENGGGIYMKDHSTVIVRNNSDATFISNSADNNGGAVFLSDHSSIIFDQNSMAIFNDNNANSGTIYSEINCNVTFQAACEVTFSNNSVQANGSAISSSDNCYITFTGNSKVTFINNKVKDRRFVTEFCDGGAIYLRLSHISFERNSITLFRGNVAYGYGGAISSVYDSSISFKENSITDFTNNTAGWWGGAIYTSSSSISFGENSTTDFTNNTATYGGAIFNIISSISFEDTSTTDFTNNTATYEGGAICTSSSSISFADSSTTDFTNNTATYGGAIYTSSSSISFADSSTTDFTNSTATYGGGAIYTSNSSISFEDSSTTDFINNTARHDGGAINSYTSSSSIYFKENSTTHFTNNNAKDNGGAIYTSSSISYEENSTTHFTCNTATYGGAIYTSSSSISFEDSSTTDFTNNTARDDGGAIYTSSSSVSFEDSSTTDFTNNTARDDGGAIYTSSSSISFEDSSTTDFTNNTARDDGGAIYTSSSSISFINISNANFNNNVAISSGGAIHSTDSTISSKSNSHIQFNNNAATRGGAIYSIDNNFISFEGLSTTVFSNNIAKDYGGALLAEDKVEIIFSNNSTATFANNKAPVGETIYCGSNSKVTTKENSTVIFNDVLAKWCTNTCLPYTGQGTVTIDINGIVMCSDQKAFECLSENCKCNDLGQLLDGVGSNTVVNIADKAILSSYVELFYLTNVSIIGQNNLTVFCMNTHAIVIDSCNNLTIQGITWIGCGVYSLSNTRAAITISSYYYVSSVIIQKTSFQYSIGPAIEVRVMDYPIPIKLNLIIDQCNFMNNNNYRGHGAAITYNIPFFLRVFGTNNIKISNCNFSYNEGAKSIVYLENSHGAMYYNNTFYNNQGVSIYLSHNCSLSISGDILFKSNRAENGAGIYISNHSTVIFGENSNVEFINNSVDHNGSAIFMNSYSNVTFEQNSIATFNDNKGISGTIYSEENSEFIFAATSRVIFNSNSVMQYGAAIYSLNNSHVIFTGSTNVKFMNNSVGHNGSAIFMKSHSSVTFEHNSIAKFNDNKGISGTIYFEDNSNITFKGTSQVIFNSNSVMQYGAAIYSFNNSHVIFTGSTNVKFMNNSVGRNGSAIFMNSHSSVTFEQNSIATFNDNKGISGTIYFEDNSNITFKGTSQVIFNSNSVMQYGAAIYSFYNSHVTFTGSSNVTFSNNVVSTNERSRDMEFGGIIFSSTHSHISFDGNSTIVFSDNSANVGAAILSFYKSSITFKDRSKVMFNSNVAQYCGILTSAVLSNIVFGDNTKVTFNHNILSCTSTSNYESSAGAICTAQRTNVMFSGHSLVTFINNTAEKGGTVAFSNSNVTIEEYSTVTFSRNIAEYSNGGAFVCFNNSIVTIRGNSNVTFNNNKASQSGGAIHSYNMCKITFKDNSTSSFIKNTARNYGGAILSNQLSEITFEGNSTIKFNGNIADNGGTFYFTNSTIIFKDISTISFYNNSALYGGAVSANDHSNTTVSGNSVLSFVNNEASQSGGAGYFNSNCNIIIKQDAIVTFDTNKALQGGALCLNNKSMFLSKEYSTSLFYNNLAIVSGGSAAVLTNSKFTLQDDVKINFSNNRAQYGGAILLDASAVMGNGSDEKSITFTNNIARVLGDSVYQDVVDFCNRSCLTDRVVGINDEFIATPPNELKFYDPAICIDDDNDTQCNSYYVQNIMLGSDIVIPACVFNHYNHSVESTQFLLQSEYNSSYDISGPEQVLIDCNTFKGISILGNQVSSDSTNFSITIKLNVDHNPDWKQISVTLIVELSECHLGFWQSSKLQQCECYNVNDIVFCSGSSSTIKKGYWFGSVMGKPTVTFCPINYCNFTCCETSNGYYHLSPVRNDQCRSHRSGTACGSCKDGYTLSFDSTECLNIESCTAGQTVLVILLTVTYWIVIVILVFAIMYYKFGIGYLYCITYYYSIVDILLSQNLQASRGLYLTISIMSSFSKITPQFLGELCLTTGMSGIDQQFIHYIHPGAIVLIIVMISLLARRSPRFTAIISRGIIHVICLLLLLSYTSIASTSLLLMRSLTFHQNDKVYTYLSPDIEYFQGRHLAYGIVALLCSFSIVPGLPLLLTLQPILNRKFNFVKIKPLLDQFQGCYKDNYRCFAGYYMICRLVIMIIIIANSSNELVASYVLIVACEIIALIHLTVKPYKSDILNKFDGVILHLIILIAVLPLLDDFDSPIVIIISFVLVILPLAIFVAVTLFLHRDNLKKLVAHSSSRSQTRAPNNDNDSDTSTEAPTDKFHLIIDDNARQNVRVTICDM